jgi:hypothetical protein
VKREEAVALLREMVTEGIVHFNWVSLVNGESGLFELHVKPEFVNSDSLRRIVQNRKLAMREANGVFIIYTPYNVP